MAVVLEAAPDGTELLDWLDRQDDKPRIAPEGWPGRRFGLVCVRRSVQPPDPPQLTAVIAVSPADVSQLCRVDGDPKLWFRVLRTRLVEAIDDTLVFEDPT